jgi:hypothetical protein
VKHSRDIAAIVILLTVPIAGVKSRWQRLTYFMFIFGICDIFYCIRWMKLVISLLNKGDFNRASRPEDYGGYRIRKFILSGKYPKSGLPDIGSI